MRPGARTIHARRSASLCFKRSDSRRRDRAVLAGTLLLPSSTWTRVHAPFAMVGTPCRILASRARLWELSGTTRTPKAFMLNLFTTNGVRRALFGSMLVFTPRARSMARVGRPAPHSISAHRTRSLVRMLILLKRLDRVSAVQASTRIDGARDALARGWWPGKTGAGNVKVTSCDCVSGACHAGDCLTAAMLASLRGHAAVGGRLSDRQHAVLTEMQELFVSGHTRVAAAMWRERVYEQGVTFVHYLFEEAPRHVRDSFEIALLQLVSFLGEDVPVTLDTVCARCHGPACQQMQLCLASPRSSATLTPGYNVSSWR